MQPPGTLHDASLASDSSVTACGCLYRVLRASVIRMYDLADPDPAAPGVDVIEWPSGGGSWTAAISDEGKRALFATGSG
eukprot:SAG31_NODE_30984_length_373_cov_3.397810_1_plen_78_part_01